MKLDQHDYEKIEQFTRGVLKEEERNQLLARMASDAEFKIEAERYIQLIDAVKFYGQRNKLQSNLNEIHATLYTSSAPETKTVFPFRKYWRVTAVAASVFLVSTIGIFLMTRSLEQNQSAQYKELRRDVEKIQKSQKQIINDLEQVKENPLPSGRYSGTGFLLSSTGYVATSYHVIRDADSITIENEAYGRLRATVIFSDAKNDIALLRINEKKFKLKQSIPFTIRNRETDLGEIVYTLGFPREDIVYGEGAVSASTGFRQNPNAYQVSVPVNPGNSGGPLLNSNGEVIGLVSGVQTETTGAAFAIKSTTLMNTFKTEALDSLQTPLALPKKNLLKSVSRVQQVKKLRDFVFMIRVYKDR